MLSINSRNDGVGGGYARKAGHPTLGLTSGNTYPVHIKYKEEDIDEEELDSYVDDVIANKIRKVTDSNSTYRVDLGMSRGKDPDTLTKNAGRYSLAEFSGDHGTTIAKGISPRITYRTKTNTKGPSQNSQGSAKYIRSAPGRQDGTLDGWSHSPRPFIDDDDRNIYSLTDILEPVERSFYKHQNKINRIKKLFNSIEG